MTTKLKIREVRKAYGKSQAEVIRASGLSKPSVAAYERGEGNPTIDTLDAIANAIGCQIVELIEAAETPTERDLREAIRRLTAEEREALLVLLQGVLRG